MTVALIYLVTFNIVTVQELWRAFFSKSCGEIVDRYLKEIAAGDEAAKLLKPDLVRSLQRGRFRFLFLDPDSEAPVFVHHERAKAGQGEGKPKKGEVSGFVKMCIAYDFPKDEGRPEKIVGDVDHVGEFWVPDLKFRKVAERLLV